MSNTTQNAIDLLTSSNIKELALGSNLIDETTTENIQAFVDENPDLDSVKRWVLIQDIGSALTEQDFAKAIAMWDKSLEQAILFHLSEYDQILLEEEFAFESLEIRLQYQNEAGYGSSSLESPNEFIAKIEPLGGTCHTFVSIDLSGNVDPQELLSVASLLLDDWTSEDLGILDWEGNELDQSWDVWYVNSKLKLITNDTDQFPNFELFEEALDDLDVDDYECGFVSNSSYMDECTISFYSSNNDEDCELLESEVSLEFLFAWMISKGINIAVRPTLISYADVEKKCVLEVAENRYAISADDWTCLF